MAKQPCEKATRQKGSMLDMDSPRSGISMKVAKAARELPLPRMAGVPCLVVVVISSETLVVTMSGIFVAPKKGRDHRAADASVSGQFPAAYFAPSIDLLRKEIERITENRIVVSKLEVEKTTGSLVYTFTTGCVPEVCVLGDHAGGYHDILSEIAHQP